MDRISSTILLILILLASLSGAARFGDHDRLDRFTLLTTRFLSLLGSLGLLLHVTFLEQAAYLVPLILLLTLQGSSKLLENYFLEIVGLPFVGAEIYALNILPDLWPVLTDPHLLLMGGLFQPLLVVLMLRGVRNLPPQRFRTHTAWSPFALALKLDAFKSQAWHPRLFTKFLGGLFH